MFFNKAAIKDFLDHESFKSMIDVFKTWLAIDKGFETARTTIDFLKDITNLEDFREFILKIIEFSYHLCNSCDNLVMIHSMKHKEGSHLLWRYRKQDSSNPMELETDIDIFKMNEKIPVTFIWKNKDKKMSKSGKEEIKITGNYKDANHSSDNEDDNDAVIISKTSGNREEWATKSDKEGSRQEAIHHLHEKLLSSPPSVHALLPETQAANEVSQHHQESLWDWCATYQTFR
jgi:hypothetical protein